MDHDHLPALAALLYAAPLAVLALGLVHAAAGRGWAPAAASVECFEAAGGRAQMIALCLLMAGTIHLGLVPGHAGEPLLAASFAVAGAAFIALAGASLTTNWWPAPAAILLVAVPGAYLAMTAAGVEGVDVLGVATSIMELAALGVLLASGHVAVARATR